MTVQTNYDPEADVIYIRLADGEVASTLEVQDGTNVDLDAEEHALGLELFAPGRNIRQLASMAERFGFESQLMEIQRAVLADLTGRTYSHGDLLAVSLNTTVRGLDEETFVTSSSLGDPTVRIAEPA